MKVIGVGLLLCVWVAACDSSGGVKFPDRTPAGQRRLEELRKSAKTYYMEKQTFPIGTVGPTPATSCCEERATGLDSMKCAPNPSYWQDPIWKALGFSVDAREPFRYSYESADGKRFTAKAVSDVDCDNSETEIVLVGNSEGGQPSFDIVLPPRID
jgi:hypothetical protein